MSLFQKTVLKKHLLEANTPEVDAAYKRFSAYFHDATRQQNIRNSKEEKFVKDFVAAWTKVMNLDRFDSNK
jgi:hypothetical protein